MILFIFIALLAGDQFTRDQVKNWSVTQGIPISWKRQWRSRSLMLWGIIWSVTLLGVVTSYLGSLFFETSGTLNYPVPIYLNQTTEYLPIWQYTLILLGSGMILSFIVLLIANGLSWIIRNIYLTILLVTGLYFLPAIGGQLTSVSSWQPSFYFNIQQVVQGTSARIYGLEAIEIWKLPIVLFILWVILELAFKYIFNLIPTQTLGLKRRKSL